MSKEAKYAQRKTNSSHNAIPFDYGDAAKAFIDDDDDGLDFGLVMLRPYYRALLEKNNIVPIEVEHWKNQASIRCDRHMVLGFPTEFTEKGIRRTTDGYHLTGALSPTMTWVTKLDAPPPGAAAFSGR